jgi:endonuclease I
MKRILPFCILLLSCFQAGFAQTLLAGTSTLAFADRTTGTVDSLKLTLRVAGSGSETIVVRNIVSLSKAFRVKDTTFTVSTNNNKDIWVYFNPVHNINHLSYLMVLNSSRNPQLLVQLKGAGIYPENYYAATQNLSEQALKDALKTIVTAGQASCTYNGARDQMFLTIDNKKTNGQGATTNTLECVYTGREAVGYTTRAEAQTNDNFNTEHTWPQSLFSSAAPMVCDLHHLFPTDEVANGTRSNYPFGMVGSPTWTVGGSKFAGGIFEPRDFHKGRVARAMMYFVLRYQDYSNFFAPQEKVLRTWHKQFGPTAIDTKRNNDIASFQGNRNPFIDHPEMLDRITLLSGTSVASVRKTIQYDSAMVEWTANVGDSQITRINIVNTGNTAIQYTAAFTLQHFLLRSVSSGTLNPDSAYTCTFSYAGSDSVQQVTDTLVITSTASNAAVMRIPVRLHIAQTTGLAAIASPIFTFQCSPNPSNQELSISSHNAEKFDVSIVTLQGQKVYSEVQQASFQIHTGELPNGLYFVIGNTPDQTFRTKIYIQH